MPCGQERRIVIASEAKQSSRIQKSNILIFNKKIKKIMRFILKVCIIMQKKVTWSVRILWSKKLLELSTYKPVQQNRIEEQK